MLTPTHDILTAVDSFEATRQAGVVHSVVGTMDLLRSPNRAGGFPRVVVLSDLEGSASEVPGRPHARPPSSHAEAPLVEPCEAVRRLGLLDQPRILASARTSGSTTERFASTPLCDNPVTRLKQLEVDLAVWRPVVHGLVERITSAGHEAIAGQPVKNLLKSLRSPPAAPGGNRPGSPATSHTATKAQPTSTTQLGSPSASTSASPPSPSASKSLDNLLDGMTTDELELLFVALAAYVVNRNEAGDVETRSRTVAGEYPTIYSLEPIASVIALQDSIGLATGLGAVAPMGVQRDLQIDVFQEGV